MAATINIEINPTTLENIIEVIRNVRNEPPMAIAANTRNLPLIPINSKGRCSPRNTSKE